MIDTVLYEKELAKLEIIGKEKEFVTEKEIANIFGFVPDFSFLCFVASFLEEKHIEYYFDSLLSCEEITNESIDTEVNTFLKKVNGKIYKDLDAVSIYMQEISEIPLLTKEEEFELGVKIQRGNRLEQLDNITEEMKKEIIIGIKARNMLIESNLRLVVFVAKGYLGRGLSFLDIVQEGNIGLMKAAYRYNPEYGCRFSTYGIYWIRQAIMRAVVGKTRMVKLPFYVMNELSLLKKKRAEYYHIHKVEPTLEDLAKIMQMDVKYIEFLMELSQDCVSLDDYLLEEDITLEDTIEDTSLKKPSSCLDDDLKRRDYEKAFSTLPALEKEVIMYMYGFTDNMSHEYEEVANKFHLTIKNARLLERQALAHLRHPARMKLIK